MNKPFLVLAGARHYPRSYTGDWRGVFASKGEAEDFVIECGGKGCDEKFKLKGSDEEYDWVTIVDLREVQFKLTGYGEWIVKE